MSFSNVLSQTTSQRLSILPPPFPRVTNKIIVFVKEEICEKESGTDEAHARFKTTFHFSLFFWILLAVHYIGTVIDKSGHPHSVIFE